jgi:hypothetical protein
VIGAVQFDEVEGIEEDAFVMVSVANEIERSNAVSYTAGRQFIGFGGKARRDEPGRYAVTY